MTHAEPQLRLNASALSDPSALLLRLYAENLENSFTALVDSGSSHCFIDSDFVDEHGLQTSSIPPLRLSLFDGSSNTSITRITTLPVHFPSGEVLNIDFYVTPLDKSVSAVLGYSWLSDYNPLIDWKTHSIQFRTTPSARPVPLSGPEPPPDSRAPGPPPKPPSVSLIGAAAFACACKLQGSESFTLNLSAQSATARSTSVSDAPPPDLPPGVPEEYREFADVFNKAKADTLPEHRPYDLKIELEDGAVPPLGPIYSLSQLELDTLREYIEENLRSGFIAPSNSPCGSPVLFVKKKDGSLRLCVYYRGLNKITRKDRYPLPLISDLLDAPRKARIYTKIDLRHAYNLVRIAPGDEWKTAFRTRYGSFEWRVMPFGLSNAPAAFQRFVNDIFADLLDVCVVVYLDDILIYSNNPADHRKHVKEVLRRLRKHQLYARADKCEFHTESVEYLGYILSAEGLTMSTDKVKTILEWPEPRKVRDIQSFLGFANFYRRFIPNYSEIVIPLTRLTRKNVPWNFSDACRDAFNTLKKAFTTAPVLHHWEPDRQITVETDASDYAIAGILSITSDSGELHPIAFHSRTLSGAELNYDTHDKELLAIYEAFKTWRHYLEGSGTPVDVVTDHKNLEYFSTTKLLTRRQARWSEYLSQFNMVIRFRPGKLGAKPDALTRRWDVYPKEGDSDYSVVNPHNFRPVFTQEQLASSLRATILHLPVLRAVFALDDTQLRTDILSAQNSGSTSPELVAGLKSASDPNHPRWTFNPEGFLCLNNRIYVPDLGDLRLRVLRARHDHPTAGHWGQNKTQDLVLRDYNWPGLRIFVRDYCKSCTTCARSKTPRHLPYGTLKQLPIPERPWNSISMDLIEQLPDSEGYTAILVIVDRLTKQSIFIPTHNTLNAQELAELFILHVFSKHGVPSHVTSDRGSEFVSHFFRSLGKALDMKLHFTSGYHPEGDGQTERVNQTLEQYLRIYCNYQQDNWSKLLPLAEFAYNNAPNATTGLSPFFANKGYHPGLAVHPERDLTSARAREFAIDLDELHSALREHIAEAQARYQVQADKHRLPAPDFRVGDYAYVRAEFIRSTRPAKKLSEKFLGPYEIIAQPGTHSFTLRLPESMRAIHPVFHVSQLEPATPNTIPGRVQTPPPPIEIDGEPEYEISEVLDSKIDRRRRSCQLLYLVRWAGYEGTDEETSWILATELEHAQELLADFHRSYPDKPGPLTSL